MICSNLSQKVKEYTRDLNPSYQGLNHGGMYTRSGLNRTFSTILGLSYFLYNCSTVHDKYTGVNIFRPMNKNFGWKIAKHVLYIIYFIFFNKEK